MVEIVSPEGQSVLFFNFWVIFVEIASLLYVGRAQRRSRHSPARLTQSDRRGSRIFHDVRVPFDGRVTGSALCKRVELAFIAVVVGTRRRSRPGNAPYRTIHTCNGVSWATLTTKNRTTKYNLYITKNVYHSKLLLNINLMV
jgi:hypothetical protein